MAVHIAAHHPLTGIGPDAFALAYPHYQSAAWVAGLGPNYLVNGGLLHLHERSGRPGFHRLTAIPGAAGERSSLRSIGLGAGSGRWNPGETEADEVREEVKRHRITVAMVTASPWLPTSCRRYSTSSRSGCRFPSGS